MMSVRMKVMVFLQGTAIMHAAAEGVSRGERVQQVRDGEPSVRAFSRYVPADDVVAKLRAWSGQGAEIVYLSAHRAPPDVAKDEAVLARSGFPRRRVLFREGGATYAGVVAAEMPDILIEDDCESIGAEEIAYTQLGQDVRRQIRSIVVPEFGGFAHLPDSLQELAAVTGQSPGSNE
jgi:hypothetical protein